MNAASLPTNLAHQLEQATELRILAYSVVEGEHKGEFTRARNLALALFYRTLQTHEATEILIRQKLVEDARVLVRVLVEQAVNCAYMLVVADDDAATDFVTYPKFCRYKLVSDLRSIDEDRLRKSVPIEREEEIRLEHEALYPRFKNRRAAEWCVDGQLYQRATRVDEEFAQKLEQTYVEFRWMVNSEWRFASSHVHAMADSLLDQVTQLEGVITIEQRFDPEDAASALYSANFALALVLPLVDSSLGEKYASHVSNRTGKFTGQT